MHTARKRKLTVTLTLDSQQLQEFCGKCYKSLNQLLTICNECSKRYHQECFPKDVLPSWKCENCRNSSSIGLGMDPNITKLIRIVDDSLRLKELIPDDTFGCTNATDIKAFRSTVTASTKLIKRNLDSSQYNSISQYSKDIHNLIFKCVISIGSENIDKCHKAIMKWVKSSEENLDNQLNMMENCVECFMNCGSGREDWFVMVCRHKHRVVWAKYDSHPPWPAKVIKEGDRVLVQFFDEVNSYATVDREMIEEYADDPEKHLNCEAQARKKIDKLMPDVKRYAQNLRDSIVQASINHQITIASAGSSDTSETLLFLNWVFKGFNEFQSRTAEKRKIEIENLNSNSKAKEDQLNEECTRLSTENQTLEKEADDQNKKIRALELDLDSERVEKALVQQECVRLKAENESCMDMERTMEETFRAFRESRRQSKI